MNFFKRINNKFSYFQEMSKYFLGFSVFDCDKVVAPHHYR